MPLLRAPYGLALAKNENEDRVQEVVRSTKNSEKHAQKHKVMAEQ